MEISSGSNKNKGWQINNRDILLSKVVDSDLCSACGTCLGVCPANCFDLSEKTLEPQANDNQCIDCGLCLAGCPGNEIDYEALSEGVFDPGAQSHQQYGHYLKAIFGQAKNIDISGSAAGGVVSGIAKFLLDEQIVQGVICAGYSEEKPWVPEGKLIRNGADIVNHAGSKYVCIPVNAVLKKIEKNNGNYAIIGVPCAIEGILKVQAVNKILKEKIFLKIGIFCGINVKQTVTDKLLAEIKVDKNKIKKYLNRDKDSGYLTKVTLDDNNVIALKKSWGQWPHLILAPYYTPLRCKICTNLTNEFADIAIGDTWSKKDWNIVLARTPKGLTVLDKYIQKGHLSVQEHEFRHTDVIINKKISTKIILTTYQKRLNSYSKYINGQVKEYQWRFISKIKVFLLNRLFNNKLFKELYCCSLWKSGFSLFLAKNYLGWWNKKIKRK